MKNNKKTNKKLYRIADGYIFLPEPRREMLERFFGGNK